MILFVNGFPKEHRRRRRCRHHHQQQNFVVFIFLLFFHFQNDNDQSLTIAKFHKKQSIQTNGDHRYMTRIHCHPILFGII